METVYYMNAFHVMTPSAWNALHLKLFAILVSLQWEDGCIMMYARQLALQMVFILKTQHIFVMNAKRHARAVLAHFQINVNLVVVQDSC